VLRVARLVLWGGPMAHPLRWFVPDTVYEYTTRTIQERFLLRPSAQVRALVLGIVARGLLFYPAVRMHAFAFLSNHWHTLVSSSCGEQLAAFMGYVNGNVAQEIGRIHGWRGRFWARRTRAISVLDDAALIDRLRYLLAQGVKEGLVARPEDWPGATSTPWLLGEELVGIWIDRDLETRARKRKTPTDPSVYTHKHKVRMEPLPCWSHLTRDEIAARTRALIDEVVAEARSRYASVVGVDKILAQDPHAAPAEPARGPAPLCHASSQPVRAAFRTAYLAFVTAYRAAVDKFRASSIWEKGGFPPGSFPSRAFHVQGSIDAAASWLIDPVVASLGLHPPSGVAFP
jgi:hypothetical protein